MGTGSKANPISAEPRVTQRSPQKITPIRRDNKPAAQPRFTDSPPLIVFGEEISRIRPSILASFDLETYVRLSGYDVHPGMEIAQSGANVGAGLGYTFGVDPGYVNYLTLKLLYFHEGRNYKYGQDQISANFINSNVDINRLLLGVGWSTTFSVPPTRWFTPRAGFLLGGGLTFTDSAIRAPNSEFSDFHLQIEAIHPAAYLELFFEMSNSVALVAGFHVAIPPFQEKITIHPQIGEMDEIHPYQIINDYDDVLGIGLGAPLFSAMAYVRFNLTGLVTTIVNGVRRSDGESEIVRTNSWYYNDVEKDLTWEYPNLIAYYRMGEVESLENIDFSVPKPETPFTISDDPGISEAKLAHSLEEMTDPSKLMQKTLALLNGVDKQDGKCPGVFSRMIDECFAELKRGETAQIPAMLNNVGYKIYTAALNAYEEIRNVNNHAVAFHNRLGTRSTMQYITVPTLKKDFDMPLPPADYMASDLYRNHRLIIKEMNKEARAAYKKVKFTYAALTMLISKHNQLLRMANSREPQIVPPRDFLIPTPPLAMDGNIKTPPKKTRTAAAGN